jgi:hypothetical protein
MVYVRRPPLIIMKHPVIRFGYFFVLLFFLPGICYAAQQKDKKPELRPDGIVLHSINCPGPGGALKGKNNGDASLNYHFLVRKDGTVISGKPEKAIIPHIGNRFVGRSLSVMLEGDFDEKNQFSIRQPLAPGLPGKQREALTGLLFSLMKKHNIPLSQIERHIDNNEEIDCPGADFPYFDLLFSMAEKMIKDAGKPVLSEICKSKKIKIPIDNAKIVIIKSKSRLELYSGDTLLKTYRAGFSDPKGDKLRKGDCKTPVGSFCICEKYPMRAWMELSYPDEPHAKKALAKKIIDKKTYDKINEKSASGGIPQHATQMGYDVGIHAGGYPYGKMKPDTTAGCIALEDPEAFELYNAVPVGSEVVVRE